MAITYEPIATTTLGSAASSITFSSIPNTYTDLKLVVVVSVQANGQGINYAFNGDTGSKYSNTHLTGDGTSATSYREANQIYFYLEGLSDIEPGIQTLDIFNYAGSTFKTILGTHSSDRNGQGSTSLGVSMWRSTSAITSLSLNAVVTFDAGTTATLYGIKAA